MSVNVCVKTIENTKDKLESHDEQLINFNLIKIFLPFSHLILISIILIIFWLNIENIFLLK